MCIHTFDKEKDTSCDRESCMWMVEGWDAKNKVAVLMCIRPTKGHHYDGQMYCLGYADKEAHSESEKD